MKLCTRRRGGRLGDQAWLIDGSELDHDDAVGMPRLDLPGHLEREAGLAAPTDARQRDETSPIEEIGDGGDLGVTSYEGRARCQRPPAMRGRGITGQQVRRLLENRLRSGAHIGRRVDSEVVS